MNSIVCAEEYDYYKRLAVIDKLCKKYPFIKKNVIGKSCLGKDITSLKIGAAEEYSLIAAAVHGSERITSTVLLMFIEELLEALLKDGYIAGFNARRALGGRGVIFVPCVNPDGCDISLNGIREFNGKGKEFSRVTNNNFKHWNSNARGVDINHNFDAGWQNLKDLERKEGINFPGPTRFGGERPESEPETLALTNLCRKNTIRHVVALHSQGEVIYWNFGEKVPPKSKRMAEIMATSSGYALDTPIGIAYGGGFKDWFISEFNRPGFTVEIGKGENPLEVSKANEIYEQIKEMLMLCVIM